MKDIHRHTHVQSGWKLYEEDMYMGRQQAAFDVCLWMCALCVYCGTYARNW